MSSNARKTVPAGVLAHPAVQALIAQARPTGTVSADDVRRATEEAGVEARDLKALMAHLAGLGVTVDLPAPQRAVAATTTKKTATTAKTAAKAPAKKTAAKAPAKKAAAAPPAVEEPAADEASSISLLVSRSDCFALLATTRKSSTREIIAAASAAR